MAARPDGGGASAGSAAAASATPASATAASAATPLPDATPTSAISVEGLAFSYDNKAFIQGFSERFESGKVTSIVGPNGCGKSTLVRLIDGLHHPQAGRVLIAGTDTLALSSRQRARRLAVLSQTPRLPAMSVYDLVACGRFPYHSHQGRLGSDDREHVESAIAMAGIAQFRDHDIRRLSGGERQKAFIAMVLAQDTEIVMLDEPTTFLDIKACHDLMTLVTRLNTEMGKTIIMVIHDLDLALRYSEQILVMNAGRNIMHDSVDRVLASGTLEEVFCMRIHQVRSEEGTAHVLFPN